MMKRGFSVLEILIVIAIIGVLAALTTPALVKAKKGAIEVASLSNLHQIHIAYKLYQEDNGGDGEYGTPSEMALPFGSAISHHLGMTPSVWVSPCGVNPFYAPRGAKITYHNWTPSNPEEWPDFARYAQTYRENLILVSDFNCDDHELAPGNPYVAHKGLGVLLSGQLVKRMRKGAMILREWWSDPPDL